MTRTHIDLFAGLAGFSLAAAASGVQTVMQVENNPFLLAGLKRAWPNSRQHDDIKTFDAKPYRGIWAVMGGPPCQSVSRAGKRRGQEDDRYLWHETVRVVEDSEPTWFLFENVAGLAELALDRIISQLAGLGYEVQPLSIPACAVDSPQDRERIWILGHRTEQGRQRSNAELLQQPAGRIAQPTQGELVADGAATRQASAAPTKLGIEESKERRRMRAIGRGRSGDSPWSNYEWLPCADNTVRRLPTGFHDMAHGVHVRIPRRLRAKLIGALGNSIVPQIATQIIASMIKSEE